MHAICVQVSSASSQGCDGDAEIEPPDAWRRAGRYGNYLQLRTGI